jgi:tRNA A37 threonylcarbamoyladenosine synthetase subunit TsaC/SUA5/YrdC
MSEAIRLEGWEGNNNIIASTLSKSGTAVVLPTKVGYIIATTDKEGLDTKFDAKNRPKNKPGVVLLGSLEQLRELAQLNEEVMAMYQECWDKDILLGCILPWKDSGKELIPNDGSAERMMDARETSCFVIKFGVPGEEVAKTLWKKQKKLVFASSANESGEGNGGKIAGIGKRIESMMTLIVPGDEYVASMQPEADAAGRHGQGVMVSMVDEKGNLVPLQNGKRNVSPCPYFMRMGLYNEEIMTTLSSHFLSWDFRQGSYN